MKFGSYKPGMRLAPEHSFARVARSALRVAARAAFSVLLVAACCGAAWAQEAAAPAASKRQREEPPPRPAQPSAPRVRIVEAAPRTPTEVSPLIPAEAAPRIPASAPVAPVAATTAQGRRPVAPPAPKAAPMPPRQVVTVVHRLSGWKLLTWLAANGPSTMQLDSLPSTEDAHTNIVAGFVYDDGRTVVARLPPSEVELESMPDPPPSFVVAATAARGEQTEPARAEQPEFTLVTADNRRVAAKFIGLDAATGLSMLEAAQPLLNGPSGDNGDTEDPTVGQRVHLYAPAPAPAAQSATRAGERYMLLSIDQREGRLTEVRRAPSGKPFRVVASVSVTPDWTGAVAVNESGEVVGIVSQSGDGVTQIVPVAAVHSACDRVLKLKGSAPRPWLGVRGEAAPQSPQTVWPTPGLSPVAATPSLPNRQGVVLTSVAPGTPAARAGLLPGDVIARVGARDVRSVEDLSLTLDEEGVGSTVEFTVLRAFTPTPLKLNVQLQGAQNPALATALSEERAARESLLSLRRQLRAIQTQAGSPNAAPPTDNAAALARLSERLREAQQQFDRVLPLIARAEMGDAMNRAFAAVVPGQPFPPFEAAQASTPLPAFGLLAIGLTGRSAARLNARGGMLVIAVRPDSPAAASGLRAFDVIETLNGDDFNRLELRRLLTAFDAPPVILGVVRDGHPLTLKFSLAGDEERQK